MTTQYVSANDDGQHGEALKVGRLTMLRYTKTLFRRSDGSCFARVEGRHGNHLINGSTERLIELSSGEAAALAIRCGADASVIAARSSIAA